MLKIECEKEYFDKVLEFAFRVGKMKSLIKQLRYLDKYAEHGIRGNTICNLYKDFAPYSFTFGIQIKRLVRNWMCPKCFRSQLFSANENGTIYGLIKSPECHVLMIPGNKTYKDYMPYLHGGLIFHGAHDGEGNGSFPTLSVCLNPTDGWSIHT